MGGENSHTVEKKTYKSVLSDTKESISKQLSETWLANHTRNTTLLSGISGINSRSSRMIGGQAIVE